MEDPITNTEIRTKELQFTRAERDPAKVFARSGIDHLRAMARGDVLESRISSHFGLRIVRVEHGDVVMPAEPDESHYNPTGAVHGGFFATALDSVCGCAVHSTLPDGVGRTSLEIKISFLRPIAADTGTVTAHGWATKVARTAASVDADLRDAAGRILATASSGCLIIRADGTGVPEAA